MAETWDEGTHPPQTAVAVKLSTLGWSSVAQVAAERGASGGIAHFKLECRTCGVSRRLKPDKGERLPDDWGPAHRCEPQGTAKP